MTKTPIAKAAVAIIAMTTAIAAAARPRSEGGARDAR